MFLYHKRSVDSILKHTVDSTIHDNSILLMAHRPITTLLHDHTKSIISQCNGLTVHSRNQSIHLQCFH